MFRIASMTKAVTGVAAMQCVERGQLSLDQPAGEILPELAEPQVLEGFDADGEPILRPHGGRSPCACCSRTPQASFTTSGTRR